MEMVFKRSKIFVCDIDIVKSVDEMPPILLDFMLHGSVVLALLLCLLTMIMESFQGRLLVSQLALEPLR